MADVIDITDRLTAKQKTDQNWREWWVAFQALCDKFNFPVNRSDPFGYRHWFFDEELSPSEALEAELAAGA